MDMTEKEFSEKLINNIETIKKKQPNMINEMMAPEYYASSAEEIWAEYKFPVQEWESNLARQLHGGVTAAMFDFSMGVLTRVAFDMKFVPTIELNVTYVRPADVGENVIIKAKVIHGGKRIVHLSSEMYNETTGKSVAHARGMFLNENTAGK